jgi:hypothetical protein
MLQNMRAWERDGLVTLHKKSGHDEYPSFAKITERGRALAKKSMTRA